MRAYKFLSLEYAVDNLVKHRLKIAQYEDMNDPFELHGAAVSNPIYHQILVDVIKKYGVLCFSRVDNEPLLWSHYADKHRGCCIAFEIDQSVRLEPTISLDAPRKVEIKMPRLEQFVLEAFESGRLPIEETDAELISLSEDPEFDEITKAVLLSKYSGWKYEQELRVLIMLQGEQQDGRLYFADLDARIKPVEVLLGVRCTAEDEQKLRYAANRYDPPLPIRRTTFAADSFEIVRTSMA